MNINKIYIDIKTLIILTSLLITNPVGSQSVLSLGSGTSMGITTGANLCANTINGQGILYGGGTICGGLVAIEPVVSNELPLSFDMSQNYPNPFNPATKIRFSIPASQIEWSRVSLTIYDILGNQIAVLVNRQLQPGTYEIDFDGENYSSGIYYYRLNVSQAGSSAGDFTQTKKMVLIK